MVQFNIKKYISIIAGLAIILFVIGVCIVKLSIFDSMSFSITIVFILSCLFSTIMWKWKVFQGWLVPFPNLNGLWSGYIESTFENAKKKISIDVSIQQTFFHIQVCLKTKESKSNSVVASFNINKDRNIKQLCYTYRNEPKGKILDKSPIHYGSVLLDINASNKEMEGTYWTGRKTSGDIFLKKKKS